MKKILLIIILLFLVVAIMLGIKYLETQKTSIIVNSFDAGQVENTDNSHILVLNDINENTVKEVNDYSSGFDINNVRVSIKEKSLDEKGLTLIIENNNLSGFYYCPNFELEKYVNSQWKNFVIGQQSTYDEDAIFIDKNSSIEINVLFKDSYLNENNEKIEILESGKYRINININNTMASQRKIESLEFEI